MPLRSAQPEKRNAAAAWCPAYQDKNMDQRISLITLGVNDLPRSRAFYESLGWKSVKSCDAIAFFQLNGQVLGLYPLAHLLQDQAQKAAPAPGAITLGINLREKDGVDTLLAQFLAAGGTLLKEAVETPWGGYTAYAADLDGHPWEFSWVPVFPLGENGELRIPED